jgi:hypothetical protein
MVPCIGAGTGTVPSGASFADSRNRSAPRLAERQHRQRIDRIDARAGLPRRRAPARPPESTARRSAWPPRRSASGMLVDEARMDLVGAHVLVGEQRAQEADVRRRAFQPERRQRPLGRAPAPRRRSAP